jgi:hypothetical protein
VAVDAGGNPAPDDRISQARITQDLRHLRDVAEHVRQVADLHRSAQLLRPRPAPLQVAHQRLTAHEELVHQDLPWTDGEAPRAHVTRDPFRLLRPNLQVVVDGRELAIEREREVSVCLEHLQDAIDEVDELHPEALEGPIPLAVPVGMRHEMDDGRTGGGFGRHVVPSLMADARSPRTTNDVARYGVVTSAITG